LSSYKNCWIYEKNVPATSRDLNFHFENFYNAVKDPTWPNCTNISDSKNLPKRIQHELLTCAEYLDFIDAKSWDHWFVTKNQASKINNEIVFSEVADVAKCSDLTVKLQNILNTDGEALLAPLGLPVLAQHVELVKKWKSLHSDDFLSIITATS
jgi:hypothetical protein